MLVLLEGSPSALHLTHQRTLNALNLDDRINTGRLDLTEGRDPLLSTSQDLADCLWDWWTGSPPAVVYRTRTMPSSRSIAFSENTIWEATTARPLAEAQALLVELVVAHGFDVPASWLR